MTAAILNGLRVTSARVTIPAWGRWYAEASVDGEHTITGAATLKIADLTLVGTILSGGPALGRSSFRVVAGKGGWGVDLPAKSYANDASTKLSKALGDAATEAGETLVYSGDERVGPNYVREAGPACTTLNTLVSGAWYVDEAGVTRIGSRAAGALVGKVTRVAPVDKARGRVVLAADAIATILPGVVVDGLTAVDVLHEISAEGGLRSTVWGTTTPSTLDALSALILQLDPDRRFRSVHEYRVDTISGSRLNLQPVRVSAGMPELKLVPVRPGVAGCEATVALGSRVLVGFIGGDPGYPYVAAHEDADGDRFLPTMLKLAGGSDFVALAASVATQLSTLKSAITGAAASPGDGGASLKAAILAALASWPGSVAATKVKAA